MTLQEHATNVQSRDDFVRFVREMLRELDSAKQQWENTTLERFLEALAGWSGDMDGYYANRGQVLPEQPSWRLMAEMLLAATIYE